MFQFQLTLLLLLLLLCLLLNQTVMQTYYTKSLLILVSNSKKNLHFCNMPSSSTLAFYEACQFRKQLLISFPSLSTRAYKPLELIHTNLWGLAPNASIDGFKYYIQFLDDYSRYVWIYPLMIKSEDFFMFVKLQIMVERYFETKIKAIQFDSGWEFRTFLRYPIKKGIMFCHPCSYFHAQNRRVERKHCKLVSVC